MADDRLIIEVVAESGKAVVNLKKAEQAVETFSKNGNKSLSQFSGAFNSFIGNLASDLVQKGFAAVTKAASSLFNTFVVDGVRAAQAQEAAVTDLNSALQSAGTFSQEASQDIQEFANALQASTTIGDEAVLQGVALAQSFVKTADEAKALTAAALDFAKGADLNFTEAIRRLGRGVQGSAADLANFAPAIRNLTKEQLAAGEATRIIAERFAGAAASETRTFQGAITQLSNQFGDLTEIIGDAFIKNQSFANVLQVVSKLITEASEAAKENQEALNRFVSNGVLIAIEGLKFLGESIVGSVVLFKRLQQASVAAQGTVSAFTDAVTFGLTDAGQRAQKSADEFLALEKSIESIQKSESIEAIRAKLQELTTAAAAGFGQVRESVERTGTSIQEVAVVSQAELEKERLAREKLSAEILAAAEKQIEINNLLAAEDSLSQQARLDRNKAVITETLADERVLVNERLKLRKNLVQSEIAIDQQRLKAGSDSLNALATLQTAKTKELAVLGKGAAIAQTTIDTYRGAQAAAASLSGIPFIGPALAVGAAAAFIAAGLARVAQIQGTPLASGITEVPPGFEGDNFPARLQSGERVVDRNTNQDLKQFLRQEGRTEGILAAILDRMNNLETRVMVSVGGDTLVDQVQRGLDRGRVLSL